MKQRLASASPARLLAGAAGLAAPLVDPAATRAAAPDPTAVNHGLYWLTANLAAREPLVLALDDAVGGCRLASLPRVSGCPHRLARLRACARVAAAEPGSDEGFVGRVLARPESLHLTPRPPSSALPSKTPSDGAKSCNTRPAASSTARRRDRNAYLSFMTAERSTPRRLIVRAAAPLGIRLATAAQRCTDSAGREDLALLPARLDQIDAWMTDGLLDGPSSAPPTFRSRIAALRGPRTAHRAPSRRSLARRVAPTYPGHVPAVLPTEWLAPLHDALGKPPACSQTPTD